MKRFNIIRHLMLFVPSLCLFGLVALQNACQPLIDFVEESKADLQIFPIDGSEIWGFQRLAVLFDLENPIEIISVRLETEKEEIELLNDTSILYAKPGSYEMEFCAECIEEGEVTIKIDLKGYHLPVELSYSINHQPQIDISLITDSMGSTFLDASSSTDPENQPLQYHWQIEDQSFEESIIPIDLVLLGEKAISLSVTDGVASRDDIVSVDMFGNITFTPERLTCTGLRVFSGNFSRLKPEILLGPSIRAGTQLPLDENGLLARDVVVSYAFEVEAPFGDPPPMVADNYDHHPLGGTYFKNTAHGRMAERLTVKNLVDDEMVWLDTPGLLLDRGFDPSNGVYYKAYFRAWMKPNLALCEKYFVVEIEIDTDGVVRKNFLHRL